MTPSRFQELTAAYPRLKIAVVGDFCLDRYLDIDASLAERSLETGRTVHNVVGVRSQPGGAGTIVNNLCALGIQTRIVGLAGEDGEGFELERALAALPGLDLRGFLRSPDRRTFAYTKPMLRPHEGPARELDRLDFKNWTPTPAPLQERLLQAAHQAMVEADAVIFLEQVDHADTGVLSSKVLQGVAQAAARGAPRIMLADSRRGLGHFPPMIYKMNAAELAVMTGLERPPAMEETGRHATALARTTGHPVFVTRAAEGMIGATPEGRFTHQPALPVPEPMDVVGAGDAVSANLTAALAAGAGLEEAMEVAAAAAAIVVAKLGTTGTASIPELTTALNLS